MRTLPLFILVAAAPAIRCPFWEMVFHDCVSSTWYWTDYNNKFPHDWWKRDLLNVVSGTPPADRLVQPARFSNGVVATVNFGDRHFKLDDGAVLAPRGHHVVGLGDRAVP